ncbi:Uncharacterised protein [Legionella lansingensis]|uniref:Uncharacterized protein n=1 Tax=Legionella lansingensis TaxID=45067 RepID=A0A0W0V771_9GAMM|nr:CBU_0585 family protein [Legionella lansingensis]KTD15963.1 hypothetical protein Llan_2599 [Legionella lansingensis]SNV53908.1 Uncharacterised protein [Legionella lansingensis]
MSKQTRKPDIDKAYVSPYDKFLSKFDATHKKSASQLKEIKKHQRIFYLRDNPNPKDEEGEIWEGF